jgi:hypothetical protein
MNAAEKPNRHDFNFSMGDESKRKLDDLMARCGHTQLNLTVARALALLAWVEDQSDLGRVVGSIRYGDELDFAELEERTELLRPRPRPQLVTTLPPVPKPAPIITPAPAPEPVTTQASVVPAAIPADPEPAPVNPKLVARPKVAPAPKAAPARARSHRVVNPSAMKPDDNGPIKTHAFLVSMSKVRNLLPPIEYCGHSVPGNLYVDQLQRLIEVRDRLPTATHFRINTLDHKVFFCGYTPGKGWCALSDATDQWERDPQLTAGVTWIYPVGPAIEYLKRHGKESPHEPEFDESCPDY